MSELDRMITQLEQRRAALDRAVSALRQVGGSDGSSSAARAQPEEPTVTKTGGITPAGRKRLADASRMRWAQKRAAQVEQERAEKNAAMAQKRRTTIARKKMSETMKQRWASKRAAEASQQKTAWKAVKKSAALKKQATSKSAKFKQEPALAEA